MNADYGWNLLIRTKSMISYHINLVTFLFCLLGSDSKDTCSSYTIEYMDLKMVFPSTVGEAVKMHQLDYRPPGHYFKKMAGNKGEVILTYKYQKGDFHNEYQPKETLFGRELNSYMFRFYERTGLQDSLKTALEKKYEKKFQLTKVTSSPRTIMSRNYDLFFLEVDSCMTIGLASSPNLKKADRIVVVRFLYNQTPEERVSAMMGYL